MNLLKCILTNNKCYKSGKIITPKGVMVHSTGANNPTLKRYVQPLSKDVEGAYDPDRATLLKLLGTNQYTNDWNHTDREACVHAFIGKLEDGSVATVQTLPWNMKGWHAGTGTSGKSANSTHIAYEICEDDLTSKSYFEKTKNEAVELTAMLCKLYNLDPLADGAIICHQDGYKRGIACNHGDIYGWWPKYKYTMDDFRAEVNALVHKVEPKPVPVPEPEVPLAPQPDLGDEDDMVYYETIDDVPSFYKPTIEKLVEAKVLKGTGNGVLHVSDDMCRILTVLDRLGKL